MTTEAITKAIQSISRYVGVFIAATLTTPNSVITFKKTTYLPTPPVYAISDNQMMAMNIYPGGTSLPHCHHHCMPCLETHVTQYLRFLSWAIQKLEKYGLVSVLWHCHYGYKLHVQM